MPKAKGYRDQKSRVRIEERRWRIAQLVLKGWSQNEIAREVGCTQPHVCNELKAIIEEWRAEYLQDIDSLKAREERRILDLLSLYHREFEKSCKRLIYPKHTKGPKKGEIDYDAPKSKVREVEVSGDPSLLAGIKGCIELLCKLRGLFTEAPSGPTVNVFSFDRMVEEIKRTQADLSQATGGADRLAEVERLQLEMSREGVAQIPSGRASQVPPRPAEVEAPESAEELGEEDE